MKTQLNQTARAISEEQWQLRRKAERRTNRITAFIIAIPMLAVVALSLAAAYLGVLH